MSKTSRKPSRRQLESLLRRYQEGKISRNEIERVYFPEHSTYNGKYITRLWKDVLGVDVRHNSVLMNERNIIAELCRDLCSDILECLPHNELEFTAHQVLAAIHQSNLERGMTNG